jgi:hypothetical protein
MLGGGLQSREKRPGASSSRRQASLWIASREKSEITALGNMLEVLGNKFTREGSRATVTLLISRGRQNRRRQSACVLESGYLKPGERETSASARGMATGLDLIGAASVAAELAGMATKPTEDN